MDRCLRVGGSPSNSPSAQLELGKNRNPRDFICRVTVEMLQRQGLWRGRHDTLVVRQRGGAPRRRREQRRPCRQEGTSQREAGRETGSGRD